MSNWSELPHDLLVEIAACVKKLEDFIAFGAVCKRWFEVGKKKEYYKGLWLRQGVPYLLLPVIDDNDDAREFYSLAEGEIEANVRIPKFKERKCYESLGWLLAVENDGTMCLLDPFTSVEIQLPHQRAVPECVYPIHEYVFVWKFVLSARPSETSDFIVMIICGGVSHLAFWRPGDQSWNIIGTEERCFRDVMYYGGHFYAIAITNNDGYAWVYTFKEDNPPKGRLVLYEMKKIYVGINDDFTQHGVFYILKTPDSLLMISRTASWLSEEEQQRQHKDTVKFRVYEVDV